MAPKYPAMRVARLDGDEPFRSGGASLDFDVSSFWRWAASDLANNALRGMLAEFLVARALGAAAGVRVEWDAYDCETAGGKKVEVKSAAYLQSWAQERLSAIRFGVQKTRAWEAATNEYSGQPKRQADVYVFCLLKNRDQATLDPLDLDQWEFFVVPTRILNDELRDQRSLGLRRLRSLSRPVPYAELAAAVEDAAS